MQLNTKCSFEKRNLVLIVRMSFDTMYLYEQENGGITIWRERCIKIF